MIFLTQTDFDKTIRSWILDQVTQFNQQSLDDAELAAIEEMSSYLRSRYDVATIFGQTGASRNPVIVMYLCDMVLFHLHSIISPNKTPQLRADRYSLAIDWLKRVQALNANPDLPSPPSPSTQKDYVLFSSNPKRSNHI